MAPEGSRLSLCRKTSLETPYVVSYRRIAGRLLPGGGHVAPS